VSELHRWARQERPRQVDRSRIDLDFRSSRNGFVRRSGLMVGIDREVSVLLEKGPCSSSRFRKAEKLNSVSVTGDSRFVELFESESDPALRSGICARRHFDRRAEVRIVSV